MKRMTVWMLCLAMVLSLGTPAAAADLTQSGSAQENVVSATYKINEAAEGVISVKIDWVGMSFTYSTSEAVWDPVNHVYSETTPGQWEKSTAKITVTNNSDVIVKAEIAYQPKDGFSDTDMVFTDESPYIGSAYTSEEEGTPCSVPVAVIPNGTMPQSENGTISDIGTITITVNALSGDSHYIDALSYISALKDTVRSAEQATERGQLYFGSAGASEEIDTLIMEASGVIVDDSSPVPEKNAALNCVIEAFYGAVLIKE